MVWCVRRAGTESGGSIDNHWAPSARSREELPQTHITTHHPTPTDAISYSRHGSHPGNRSAATVLALLS